MEELSNNRTTRIYYNHDLLKNINLLVILNPINRRIIYKLIFPLPLSGDVLRWEQYV